VKKRIAALGPCVFLPMLPIGAFADNEDVGGGVFGEVVSALLGAGTASPPVYAPPPPVVVERYAPPPMIVTRYPPPPAVLYKPYPHHRHDHYRHDHRWHERHWHDD